MRYFLLAEGVWWLVSLNSLRIFLNKFAQKIGPVWRGTAVAGVRITTTKSALELGETSGLVVRHL